MAQLDMFRQNIRMLIGILTLVVFLGVALLVGWTTFRTWLSARREKQSFEQFERSRHDKAGQRLPPTGMGICTVCGKAGPGTFHLPDGNRMCSGCYEMQRIRA